MVRLISYTSLARTSAQRGETSPQGSIETSFGTHLQLLGHL